MLISILMSTESDRELLTTYFMTRFQQIFDLPEADAEQVKNIFTDTMNQLKTDEPKKVGRKKRTRNISRYNIYSSEQFEQLKDENLTHRDKMSLIGQRWKKLTEEQKTHYEELAQIKNRERNNK